MRFEQRHKGVTQEIWGRDSQEGEEPVQIPQGLQIPRPGQEVVRRQQERNVGKRWGRMEGRGQAGVTSEPGLTVGQGAVVGEHQAERGVIWLISEKH